jgi:3-hydroxymyristoyl/3-hydroxydecanoyl-(acyl carrier protein) dehydratase
MKNYRVLLSMPISTFEQMIPHRAPFLFVDHILERTSKNITCQKKITKEDLYLVYTEGNEHFISEVALIECLLQSGACLLADSSNSATDDNKRQKYYVGSPIVKFGVLPKIGDTLTMHVEVIQRFGHNSRLQGKIFCESALVLEGVFLVAEK